jgi:ubiquinone/menaquinone biosynthesis C-methylase UbiE
LTSKDRAAKKFARRFDGRADLYSRYRPGYPDGVLRKLEEKIGFNGKKVVADVGSGTGILSELFLENGNAVYCVEPYGEMRRTAEGRLGKFVPLFRSVAGTAESTGLDDGSIDLIAVGQALHWFEPTKARKEFGRILVKGGYVSIVYNRRREDGDAERAYARIVHRFSKSRAEVPDVDDTYVARFLGNSEFGKYVIANSQRLNLQGMLGRLGSASYMPPQGDPDWIGLEEEVGSICDRYGEDGVVVLRHRTILYVGRISKM